MKKKTEISIKGGATLAQQ
jgi:hypothetical protein